MWTRATKMDSRKMDWLELTNDGRSLLHGVAVSQRRRPCRSLLPPGWDPCVEGGQVQRTVSRNAEKDDVKRRDAATAEKKSEEGGWVCTAAGWWRSGPRLGRLLPAPGCAAWLT